MGRILLAPVAAALMLALGATASAVAAPPAVSFDGGRLVDSGTREIGLEAGDFNEDGWDDVFTSNSNGTSDLLLNRQDNWFTMAPGFPKSSTGNNQNLVTGDFNADGHLDAAVAGSDNALIRVFLGNGAGGIISSLPYSAGSGNQPFDIATGDLNGDGALDLVTANQANTSPASAPTVTVRLGTGSGGFAGGGTTVVGNTGALARGVALGDVDNDGDSDVVVANTNANQVRILLNDGSGELTLSPTAYTTTTGPRKVVLADLDGDGDLDIATADSGDGVPAIPANRNNKSTVLLNDGAGSFTAATGSPFTVAPAATAPFAVEAADLNGDGVVDLAFANRYGGSLSLVLGNGDGTFGTEQTLPYPDDYFDAEVTDLTVMDVNHDGKPDLMGNASGSPGYLVPFLNTTTLAPPDVLGVSPASGAASGAPRISGTSDGENVRLYDTSDCSGAPVGSGTKAEFAGAGIQVSVAAGQTKTFWAAATNAAGWATSVCSASSVTYFHKPPPDAPGGMVTDPLSGGDSLLLKLSGTAEAGSLVSIYTTADCSGPATATGSADLFASPGIEVAVSAGTTQLRATATDANGSVSPCSSAVSYTALPPGSSVKPLLTGKATVGSALSVTSGTWTGIVRTTVIQWQRCNLTATVCTNVGTNSPTYALTTADGNSRLRAVVTAGNNAGTTAALSGLSAVVILR